MELLLNPISYLSNFIFSQACMQYFWNLVWDKTNTNLSSIQRSQLIMWQELGPSFGDRSTGEYHQTALLYTVQIAITPPPYWAPFCAPPPPAVPLFFLLVASTTGIFLGASGLICHFLRQQKIQNTHTTVLMGRADPTSFMGSTFGSW